MSDHEREIKDIIANANWYTLDHYPAMKRMLGILGVDNSMSLNDDYRIHESAHAFWWHAEVEVRQLTKEEQDTLVAGEDLEQQQYITRCPIAWFIFSEAFDGLLTQALFPRY